MKKRKFRRYDTNTRRKRYLVIAAVAVAILAVGALSVYIFTHRASSVESVPTADTLVVKDTLYKYGLPIEQYVRREG